MLKKVDDEALVGDDNSSAQSGGAQISTLHPVNADRPALQGPEEAEPARKGPSFLSILGKGTLVLIQAVLMVAILAGSYWIAQRMVAAKPEPRKRPAFQTVYTVETVRPVARDRQPVFSAYGQTIAARSVDLRSLVSGEIVAVNPKLRSGAQVAQGETLVEIDEFEYRGALAEARANLQEAEARIVEAEAQIGLEQSKIISGQEQLELAQSDLARAESLRQSNTVTQQQIEARRLVVSQREQALAISRDTIKVQQARVEQLKATMGRFEWRVQQAERNLNSTVLKAPFAGVVRSSSAEIGRAITANDVVVSMYEAGSLEVTFTLTDAQYGRLQTSADGLIGRTVEIIWTVGGRDYAFAGMIDRTGAEITSNKGGVEVIARLDDITNGVTLRPGAFVELRVPDVVFANTFAVPDTAIYGTNTLYTIVDDKLVENRVEIAAFENEQILISEGLKPGDEVLVTRITEVSAGLNIRREGDPIPSRDASPANSQNAEAGQGRPSREEMQRILAANNMDIAAFRALPQGERRMLIRNWRQQNASDGEDAAAAAEAAE
ncbi:MAG: efflux RND transporter periplasmic adaptor subunit [Ahrensia sp.]|nr:efflux RND transporter periplasmic adaptor subunit [Ahrensia sp.]